MPDNEPIRLNKLLALELGLSRRQADQLISSGQVKINGQVAQLGARTAGSDQIVVQGKPLTTGTQLSYIMLNKPVGYVCSRRPQGDSPTIYELLPSELHSLKPVGRLDRNSSGLILLTNDGDFAYRMTHPSFRKIKLYKVKLDRDLEPLHQQMIADIGIELDDGRSRLGLERLDSTDRRDWQVTMSEGRNRQIRRTFAALGYTVVKLHRINFGPYSLGDIKPGKYISVDMH